jgi:predicted amidohydrolase
MSTIADPKGRVLLQAPPDSESVGIVEVDLTLARDKQITARNHVFQDRRPEEYSYLLSDLA